MAICEVTKRTIFPERSLVLIVPTHYVPFPFSILYKWVVKGTPLKRFQPHVPSVSGGPGFTKFNIHTDSGLEVTLAPSGSATSATLPQSDLDIVTTHVINSPSALNAHTIQSIIERKGESKYREAIILANWLKSQTRPHTSPRVTAHNWTRNYAMHVARCLEPNKPTMYSFMDPIVDGAYVPYRTRDNEQRGINGRILEIATNKRASEENMKLGREFIALTKPEKLLRPYDISMVRENQPRPSQRKIIQTAEDSAGYRSAPQSFQKNDCGAGYGVPRMITTLPALEKVNYSQYIYALADHVKSMPWYAFGRTPRAVARLIALKLRSAKFMVDSDISRMDGRIGFDLRMLETEYLMECFGDANVIELHHLQFGVKVYPKLCEAYVSEWARLSGSAETSLFNTWCNACMVFIALRKMRDPFGQLVHTPESAYAALGLYGVDDGFTPDVDPTILEAVFADFGSKLTYNVVEKHALGVKFLSRMYSPYVWYGDESSMCDIRRQLMKFHVSTRNWRAQNEEPFELLMEKSFSFFLTDANTPIIGTLVRGVLQQTKMGEARYPELWQYCSDYPSNEQYPNEYGDWMESVIQRDLPEFDRAKFEEFAATARGRDWLRAPLCLVIRPPRVEAPVIVADEVVPSEDGSTSCVEPSKPYKKPKAHKEQFGALLDTAVEEKQKILAAIDKLSEPDKPKGKAVRKPKPKQTAAQTTPPNATPPVEEPDTGNPARAQNKPTAAAKKRRERAQRAKAKAKTNPDWREQLAKMPWNAAPGPLTANTAPAPKPAPKAKINFVHGGKLGEDPTIAAQRQLDQDLADFLKKASLSSDEPPVGDCGFQFAPPPGAGNGPVPVLPTSIFSSFVDPPRASPLDASEKYGDQHVVEYSYDPTTPPASPKSPLSMATVANTPVDDLVSDQASAKL